MLRKFFSQLLISVIFDSEKQSVRAVCVKNKTQTKTFEKSFEEPKKAYEYIASLNENYRLFYTSVLLKDAQGLLPSANLARDLGVEVAKNAILPLGNAQIYTDKANIEKVKTAFAPYGEVDLIFSPFALLYRLILQHLRGSKGGELTLYAFRYDDYLALLICENSKILYGKFCDLKGFVEPKMDEDELKELDEFMENDELGDDFSELGNADLHGADDDLGGEKGDLKGKKGGKSGESNDLASTLSGFGSDMDMCAFIFESVKEFYENPLYNARFLEKLIIFEGGKINEAVIDYIEGEIFMRPEIKSFDALKLMYELMRWELEI